MSEVIAQPEPVHDCGPNRYGIMFDHFFDPVGTVRSCPECGRTWVAYRDRYDPGYMGVKWRREGWWARRPADAAGGPVMTPYCPMCGLVADRGLMVTQRRLRPGFAVLPDLVQQTARWHAGCWRMEFGRRSR